MKELSALIIAAAALLLVSCGGSTAPPAGADAQQPAAGNGASEEAGQENGRSKAELSISLAQDSFLAQTDAYDEYVVTGAEDSEFLVKAVISTSAAVKDLRVVEVAFEGDGDTARLRATRELYGEEELTPERPLVLGLVFYGDTPSIGISFVNDDGETESYAVGMSGEDGSLLLVEF